MSNPEPTIRVNVDVTNPGQFFACCGLLELADRLWPGAEGWFEKNAFCINASSVPKSDASTLIEALSACSIDNTMSDHQLQRFRELKAKRKSDLCPSEHDEKKNLEKRWREDPVIVCEPFSLLINWFHDKYANKERYKTWAGQQSVIDIARAMHASVVNGKWRDTKCANWLRRSSDDKSVPFYFDANLGPQLSSLDVGYSLDALKLSIRIRPFLELCAFIGLQRFRPYQIESKNLYHYCVWHQPLAIQIASPVACTLLPLSSTETYEFRLLYRTKYLTSFLPATPIGVSL